MVLINQPLKRSRWFHYLIMGIKFEPQCTINAQALANILIKNANKNKLHSSHEDTWDLYVDGSSTKGNSGVDLIIGTP